MAAGEPPPGVVKRGVRRGVGRHVPDRQAGELFQTKIGARIEPHHVHVLFQHVDERHEQRAVQAVLVEILRRHVRGRHHHDAALEQLREQPSEDHGVGDVGDVEFVEAEQPSLLGKLVGDVPDRILACVLAEFHFLAEGVDALVHVEHEFVKMRAALARDRARLEEKIHQHGLAASDVAVDVETLDRRQRALAAGEQPAERRGFSRQPVLLDPRFEPRHLVDHGELRGVALDSAGGDAGGILRCNGARHGKLT